MLSGSYSQQAGRMPGTPVRTKWCAVLRDNQTMRPFSSRRELRQKAVLASGWAVWMNVGERKLSAHFPPVKLMLSLCPVLLELCSAFSFCVFVLLCLCLITELTVHMF